MMKQLSTLLGITAVALLVAGCPSSNGNGNSGKPSANGPSTTSPPRAVVPGGVLRLPLEIAADDPALAKLDLSDQRLWALARATTLPLVRVSPSGEPLPGLATAWRSDDSGKVWTFDLQTASGADGEGGIGEQYLDFMRSTLRGKETPVRQQLADLVAGAAGFRDGKALEVSGVSMSAGVLRVELTRSYQQFPLWLSQPGLGLTGFGAFMLQSDGQDSASPGVLILKPNPQSLSGQPPLEELRFICQPDRDEQVRMFRAGELDTANIADQQVVQVRAAPDLADALTDHDTAEMLLGIFNYSRFPWNDGQFQSRIGLRSAMNWGLDREMLAEVHNAQFIPWPHFLPTLWRDLVNPARVSQPRFALTPEIEKARAGMIEADHEQGNRLPQGMDLAYLPDENTGSLALDIMDYWRDISIKLGPFGEPQQVLLDRVAAGGHEVIIKRVCPAYPDADALIYPQLHGALSGAGGNWTRLEDTSIDEQVEAIQAEQDPVSRQIAIRKLGDELEDRALFVFVGYATPTLLISPRLAGYELGPYDFDASLSAQDFASLGWAAGPSD